MSELLRLFYYVIGGYPYMGLFFLSLLFVFIMFKAERELLFYPNVLILFVILNPVIIPLLNRYFLTGGPMGGTSWRIWWLIPIPFLIAVMFTKTLDFVKGKEKIAVTIMMCIVIALSGHYVFGSGNFRRTDNPYQLRMDVIEVSRMISHDIAEQGMEEHSVVAVNTVAWSIRLYNPEVKMLYGRVSYRSRSTHAVDIYLILNDEEPNLRQADPLLREENVSHIVVNRGTIEELPGFLLQPEELGYVRIGSTERYLVYRTNFE